jgi:serine/threonine protein kinase
MGTVPTYQEDGPLISNDQNPDVDPSEALDPSAVTIQNRIGDGNFGKVYKGTVRSSGSCRSDGKVTYVAIKKPRSDEARNFADEVDRMVRIEVAGGDPNIVKVLGYVHGDDPLLILELHMRGSLDKVLRESIASSLPIAPVQLTTYGLQVARAMCFLERHDMVHRDVAARNVLVSEKNECKLADFGLSRDVASKHYYRAGPNSAPIPVRWMAPETLDKTKQISTCASDRWSFAVLLWEIFNLCCTHCGWPYVDIVDSEILAHEILQHITIETNRLQKPDLCTAEVYKLMLECWSYDPNERPLFVEICERLDLELSQSAGPGGCLQPHTHVRATASKKVKPYATARDPQSPAAPAPKKVKPYATARDPQSPALDA